MNKLDVLFAKSEDFLKNAFEQSYISKFAGTALVSKIDGFSSKIEDPEIKSAIQDVVKQYNDFEIKVKVALKSGNIKLIEELEKDVPKQINEKINSLLKSKKLVSLWGDSFFSKTTKEKDEFGDKIEKSNFEKLCDALQEVSNETGRLQEYIIEIISNNNKEQDAGLNEITEEDWAQEAKELGAEQMFNEMALPEHLKHVIEDPTRVSEQTGIGNDGQEYARTNITNKVKVRSPENELKIKERKLRQKKKSEQALKDFKEGKDTEGAHKVAQNKKYAEDHWAAMVEQFRLNPDFHHGHKKKNLTHKHKSIENKKVKMTQWNSENPEIAQDAQNQIESAIIQYIRQNLRTNVEAKIKKQITNYIEMGSMSVALAEYIKLLTAQKDKAKKIKSLKEEYQFQGFTPEQIEEKLIAFNESIEDAQNRKKLFHKIKRGDDGIAKVIQTSIATYLDPFTDFAYFDENKIIKEIFNKLKIDQDNPTYKLIRDKVINRVSNRDIGWEGELGYIDDGLL